MTEENTNPAAENEVVATETKQAPQVQDPKKILSRF
jgi:hypothetical protein